MTFDTRTRLGIATALFALVLSAHVALPPAGAFAVFLALLTGAGLLASARLQPVSVTISRAAPDGLTVRMAEPDSALDDDLVSLQSEMHALQDQLRTDAARLGMRLPADARSR